MSRENQEEWNDQWCQRQQIDQVIPCSRFASLHKLVNLIFDGQNSSLG